MAEERHDTVEYRGTGLYVSLVVIFVLVVAVFIVAVQNTESVRFEFLWWDLDVPLFALIVGGGIVAVVIDELIGLAWRRNRRRRLSERRELETLRRRDRERTAGDESAAGERDAGTDEHERDEATAPAPPHIGTVPPPAPPSTTPPEEDEPHRPE